MQESFRQIKSRFRRKEELIFIGDPNLVGKAHDALLDADPDVSVVGQSPKHPSRLQIRVGHRNMFATFHPSYPQEKGDVLGVINSAHSNGGGIVRTMTPLWVVLCDIDGNTDISEGLVQALSSYGNSVLWVTGIWKVEHLDVFSTTTQKSALAKLVGGNGIFHNLFVNAASMPHKGSRLTTENIQPHHLPDTDTTQEPLQPETKGINGNIVADSKSAAQPNGDHKSDIPSDHGRTVLQVAQKERELELRNRTLKTSLKKGARYFRWSDDQPLVIALESLVEGKEEELTVRRRSSSKLKEINFTSQSSATEITNSLELSEDDIIIAVMGPTGAGKSTFIKHATGYDLRIGDDLESCTSEIHVIRLGDSNSKIYIVDTPGFNDTNRTDLEIFKLISGWLEQRFTNQVYLSGLVYLHRISDNRMGGTTLKNLKIFEKLCGKDCFHKVTLATTMWDDLESPKIGADRENQLKNDYFSLMLNKGAKLERLQNNEGSARDLISNIIKEATDLLPLSLQKELVAYQKDLRQTDAGRKMYDKLDDVLQAHQAALHQLTRDMRAERSEQVRLILGKEHEALTRELVTLIADMQYMQLSLPARLLNVMTSKRNN